ncbi:shikimate dehydrogenase [Streptomyces qinglanensis]|uniref:Shikimate dehydrogenase n=1 Tax=Streptomyces qinglanensis TaxID=943816 RepID=A0A1H9W8Z9_9ACTN|nr:shikimate dehydrogenase [Streptomyces qinglanensis]SES30436.1 shikimate dehydrogenase [Streptomyces qinglanensis]
MPATTGQEARRAAVLGSPVAHSLSPVLHRAAYAELGLGNWTYDRYQVDEQGIGDFLARLDDRAGRWAGLSLTMPLKRAVIPLLDGISPTAASVEAVNTVLFTEDGRRTGDNTDVPGMVAALRERGISTVESATVLGAGATASSALAALVQVCGGGSGTTGEIGEIGEITVYVRSAERAREMRGWGERLGVAVRTADWARAAEGLGAPLVISTTPAGATDGLAAAAPAVGGTLFDVLYDPWPTALAAAWNGPVLGGLDLLVHQAVLQVELMTGRGPAPLAAMRAAGEAELAARAG